MNGRKARARVALAVATRWLRPLVDGVLSVALAPDCPACHRPLDTPTRSAVCETCWSNIQRLTPPLCEVCGVPLPSWHLSRLRSGRCPVCRRLPRALDGARAAGDYDGSLREILHAFKYGRMRSIAGRLADLMRRDGDAVLADADLVVPVPLHPSRRRTRGFNQAADLAARLGPPVVHALRRVRRTVPQSGLPAARRRANVRGAFAPRRRARAGVHGRTVVLVDDIWTTGATLEACAAALRQVGAARVLAITAARVTRPPRP